MELIIYCQLQIAGFHLDALVGAQMTLPTLRMVQVISLEYIFLVEPDTTS